MSEGKNLKFQFVLDEQSFARVKRAVGELTTEFQKLAKAAQAGGGMLAGANVGRPPSAIQTQGRAGGSNAKMGVGAAILGDVEAFQKLAKSGKDGMNAMTDAIRKGVREQMQEIEKLDRKMAVLQDRFKKDPRAAYEGAFRENLQQQMLARQGQLNGANGNLEALKELMPGGGTPKKGFFANAWSTASNAGLTGDLTGGQGAGGLAQGGFDALMGPSMAAMIARSVGIAVAGAVKILSTSVAADKLGQTVESKLGMAASPFIERGKRSDKSDLDVMSMLSEDGASTVELYRSVYGTDRTIQKFGKGVIDTVTGGFSGEAMTTGSMNALTLEEQNAVLQAGKTYGKYTLGIGRARDYVNGTRDERLQASRMSGRGFWDDPNSPTGHKDSFSSWRADLHRQGFSTGEALAAEMQSKQGAGSTAYSGAIRGANAAGWGEYGSLLLSSARMGNAGLAQMALGGGINRAAGLQLGQGLVGSGFDPRGTVSAEAALGAFQGGYGSLMGKNSDPASHFNFVNQALAGMQAGDAIVGGRTSGFQSGMNILSAIGAASGSDTYAQDYLANGMSFKQMMAGASGNLTETARLSGLTPEMMKKQLGQSSGAALAGWVDQGSMDQRSRAMRKYAASGQTPDEFLKTASIDEAKSIGVTLGMMNPDIGEEGGIGWAMMQKGIGTKAKKGKAPWGGVDSKEGQDRENEAEQMKKDAAQLDTYWNALLQSNIKLEGWNKATADAATKLNSDLSAIRSFIEDFYHWTPEQKARYQSSNTAESVGAGDPQRASPYVPTRPGKGLDVKN